MVAGGRRSGPAARGGRPHGRGASPPPGVVVSERMPRRGAAVGAAVAAVLVTSALAACTTPEDLAFIEAMIAHHEQAVELAELAPGRAADAELAELASRMRVVQAAEADAMRSWLDRRSSRDLPADDHGHAEAMRGEISPSTIHRAAGLEGAAFDELFIAAMMSHHRGAVEMAETRLAEAGDPAVA